MNRMQINYQLAVQQSDCYCSQNCNQFVYKNTRKYLTPGQTSRYRVFYRNGLVQSNGAVNRNDDRVTVTSFSKHGRSSAQQLTEISHEQVQPNG